MIPWIDTKEIRAGPLIDFLHRSFLINVIITAGTGGVSSNF